MKNRTIIKSVLKNWQEFVFLISISTLLFEITRFNLSQNTIDNWDLALLSLIIPLFICLIRQLYWNNKLLSTFLTYFLTTASIIFVVMAIYFIGTTKSRFAEAHSMLIFGVFLIFTSITMRRKQKFHLIYR